MNTQWLIPHATTCKNKKTFKKSDVYTQKPYTLNKVKTSIFMYIKYVDDHKTPLNKKPILNSAWPLFQHIPTQL